MAWPFILYTIVIALLVYAHFIMAYRSWRISRGEESSDIDPNYVRLEDYFGRSFRLKVSEWLKLPVQVALPDGTLSIKKGRERILVSNSAEYPPQSKSDDILVVRGGFRCGAGGVFGREIYAHGDALIGAGTLIQSMAVDGNLILGHAVRVARWVDSLGDMEIGADSSVRARATAGKILRLSKGSRAGSVFAPTVCTSRDGPVKTVDTVAEPAPTLEIPAPAAEAGTPGSQANF